MAINKKIVASLLVFWLVMGVATAGNRYAYTAVKDSTDEQTERRRQAR